MTSIKVKYRPSTVADHEGSIYYQIIHERKTRQLLSDYRVFPSEWDENRLMVTTTQTSDRKSLILSVRERIRWDVERLTKIVRKLESNVLSYTADDVIEEFHRYANEYSLFNFMEGIIVKLKQNGKLGTADNYKSTLNSIKKFLGGEDIMLDCLTCQLMEEYEAWQKKKGISPNTSSFYFRILRAIYNRAVEEEIIENHYPFKRVYTGVERTVKRAIPLRAIKRMKTLDLSLNPRLDFARDMFMMSFYLRRMSFIDLAYLRKSDLKNGVVTYRRRKTNQQLSIEWTPEMQCIVDKYPENPTERLMPILTSDSVNLRTTYHNMSFNTNYNLKKIAELIGVSIPLTMYVARHSWASAAKSKGIPTSVISEGMGHDSEATTQIYLASIETSVVDKANALIIKALK